MKLEVRVPGDSRSETLSPALKDSAVVLAAARSMVNVSPLRAVQLTTSIVVPAAFWSVSSMSPPLGLGKCVPLPEVTVRLVSVGVMPTARVVDTGENA